MTPRKGSEVQKTVQRRVHTRSLSRLQNATQTPQSSTSRARRKGCPECQAIVRAVRTPIARSPRGKAEPTLTDIEWNSEKARHNTKCTACQDLIGTFRSPANLMGTGRIMFSPHSGAWLIEFNKPSLYSTELLHVGREPHAERGIGRNVNKYRIVLHLLRAWVLQCDKHHAGQCHSILDPWAIIPKVPPLLLVDVQRMCLVGQSQVSADDRYVALSYVWEQSVSPFQTLQSNLAQLCTLGALSSTPVRDQLPRTIKDSIVLLQGLGLRYLWVDRLCIVQDDSETKPHQLASMASIYGNAYFTIAACEGDAESGLAGISRQSERKQPFKRFRFSSTCTMIQKDPSSFSWISREAYHSRGWTFQEWNFSRRLLVFHHQTVSWCCQVVQEQENGTSLSQYVVEPHGEKGSLSPMWTSWPNLESYLEVVTMYNGRTLSREEDMLNAFSAFTTVFGRTMKGDMLFGVPELFFHGMMLFTSSYYGSALKRRRCVDQDGRPLLPSWSWVAWTGNLSFHLTTATWQYVSSKWNAYLEDCGPITHFSVPDMYKILVSDGRRMRKRIRDLHYWQARYPDKETDPSCLPKDYTFNCYVPLTDKPSVAPLDLHTTILPVIEFRTGRIFGNVVPECPEGLTMDYLEGKKDYLFIQGIDGTIIGYLETRTQDVEPRFWKKRLRSNRIELISVGGMDVGWVGDEIFRHVLKRGSAYLHRHCPQGLWRRGLGYHFKCYWDRKNCLLPSDWTYRFHNVLWIECENGVAYRKAIGRVWDSCWEQAGPEEIDVVLG